MSGNGMERYESKRPYRLYDAKEKENLPYRYYKHSRNAHIGALIEIRWAKVGATIEVVNEETGRVLYGYKRGVDTFTMYAGGHRHG